jgi:hypothetical protein
LLTVPVSVRFIVLIRHLISHPKRVDGLYPKTTKFAQELPIKENIFASEIIKLYVNVCVPYVQSSVTEKAVHIIAVVPTTSFLLAHPLLQTIFAVGPYKFPV